MADSTIDRLFTHHDRLYLYNSEVKSQGGEEKPPNATSTKLFIPHFHKLFGFLALVNILLYLTPFHADFKEYLGIQRLARFSFIHVILALSSFEFRIGRARNSQYTIYREMQLHTIIFTLRSWSVMMCDFVLGIDNIVTRSAVVLFWHVLADLATKYYGCPSRETTIRRSVDGKKGYAHRGFWAHVGLWFFSFSQLVGTYMILTDSADAARNAMFIMAPVQLSAFIGTLVRKGLLSSETGGVTYFIILWPIFLYHHWTALDVAFVVLADFFRFRVRINKYLMWISFALAAAYLNGDLQLFLGQVSPDALKMLPAVPPMPRWVMVDTVQPAGWIGAKIQELLF